MVARGEIWWHEVPEASRRPYLVLTRDEGIEVLHSVLAVPATRTARGIPTEVALDAEDGMPADCVVTMDNVTVVRTAHLTTHITTLSAARVAEVCAALAFAVACERSS